MTAPSDFAACRAWLMTEEGGYSVDPVPTFEGIEQADYDGWLTLHGVKAPFPSVKNADEATITAIYKAQYWSPYCSFIPPGVNLVFFDTNVNQGQGIAVRFLQRSLKIVADDKFGVQTAAAVKSIGQPNGPTAQYVIDTMTALRVYRYHGTKDYAKYGEGWLKRAAACQKLAYQMAGIT